MTFKERLESDIETLQQVLKTMEEAKCEGKSIAIVRGYLDTAKKFRENEDEQ